MNFEVIKAYFVSPYDKPWTTKRPAGLQCYHEGYFIKVDGVFFKLGVVGTECYRVEEDLK